MADGTITYPYARGLDVWGKSAVVPFTYAGPSSYLAGGDTRFATVLGPGLVKLGVIEWILGGDALVATTYLTMVRYVWNPTTKAIQAFWGNTTPAGVWPEVTDATNLSTYSALMVAFGRG